MKENINTDNELKQDAPVLFSMEKRNLFQVPDGYFDTLASQIQDKIQSETKASWIQNIFGLFLAPRILVPVAASVVILMFVLNNHQNKTLNGNKVEITYNDLAASDYLFSIDEEIISAELVGEENNSQNLFDEYLVQDEVEMELINEALLNN